ncbi:hypothetical protein [Sporosarcina sp. USHLN248]|uniref:hypothetical protein n=1 Tax=Sporosarcina sp. USHLN248 TaxID=3081300 RepID=UPI00301804F3
MKVLFELMRIAILFIVFGGIVRVFLYYAYSILGIDVDRYGWFGSIGILSLFFVLYRNKLQFSGWYWSKSVKKLPKKVSKTLIVGSIFLLILPSLIRSFLN